MLKSDTMAREVAGYLLQINAIKLNTENPFTWASGLRAPIYCDNRRILSFPDVRQNVARKMATLVQKHYPDAELLAGVATGAIAQGVLVAERLHLPFVYVRSGSKSHGLGARVEGHVEEGKKTVVIEDLVSTGKSSLAAVQALREAGLKVLGMAAVFTYNLPQAEHNLREERCALHTLSSYEALLAKVQEDKTFGERALNTLHAWRNDPVKWSDTAAK